MNVTLKTMCAAAILFGLGNGLRAQDPGQTPALPTFSETPGSMEFTGEMIVRPLQMDAAFQKTGSLRGANLLRARAFRRIRTNTLRYYGETDEYIVRVPRGSNENSYSKRLAASGEYEYVEPNWRVYPVRDPNDPLYPNQWHHPVISSASAWDITIGSATQIIAYTDTGIDLTHPDLTANRVPGYNAVDQLTEAQGGQVNDINGHGTHVAGIGSAIGNNAVGVVGVGWNFRIMMVRVSNSTGGGSSIEVLTRGARWAGENGAKSVSTSYTGVASSSIQTTGAYLKGIGVLYLYAADNSNTNHSGFDWPDVIVVGATTQSDTKASFSSYGRAVDVFAPGVSILSTIRGGGYGNLSGTSMATPMANGVVALIWSRYPNVSPANIEQKLFDGCRDLGAPGNDDFWGWGRVDSYASVTGLIRVCPTSFAVTEGLHRSGGLPELCASDDLRMIVQHVPTVPPFEAFAIGIPVPEATAEVEVEATAPAGTASTVGFRFESHSDSLTSFSMRQRLELFNFITNQWEIVDYRSVSSVDSVVEVTFTTSTSAPSRFIQPVTLRMRARMGWYAQLRRRMSLPIQIQAAAPSWEARIDEATWRYMP